MPYLTSMRSTPNSPNAAAREWRKNKSPYRTPVCKSTKRNGRNDRTGFSDLRVFGDERVVTSRHSEVEVPPSPALVSDIVDYMGISFRDATYLATVLVAEGGYKVEHFSLMEYDVLEETIDEFDSVSKRKIESYIYNAQSPCDADESPEEKKEPGLEPAHSSHAACSLLAWYTPGILAVINIGESEAFDLVRLLIDEGKLWVEDLVVISQEALRRTLKTFSADSRRNVDMYVQSLLSNEGSG